MLDTVARSFILWRVVVRLTRRGIRLAVPSVNTEWRECHRDQEQTHYEGQDVSHARIVRFVTLPSRFKAISKLVPKTLDNLNQCAYIEYMNSVTLSSAQFAYETGKALGRKFEISDMNNRLRAAAEEYAVRYEGNFSFMLDMRDAARRGNLSRYGLSAAQAKAVLNCLMAEYRRYDAAGGAVEAKHEAERLTVEEAGVYVMPDNAIVKVQANKAKTNTYAKRWIEISGERLNENDARVRGEWEYAPGLINEVSAKGRKMTLEEAKAFILRYGQCVRCARKLKAAESVERGIGPVCITYFAGDATGASVLVEAQEVATEHSETSARTVKNVDLWLSRRGF